MKKYKVVTYLTCMFVLLLTGFSVAEEKLPNVAAKVNGSDILMVDVSFFVDRILKRAEASGQRYSKDSIKSLRVQWIDRLIEKELLLQEAKNKKISIDNKELQERVTAVKGQGVDIPEKKLRKLISENMMVSNLIDSEVLKKIKISDKEINDFYNSKKGEFKQPDKIKARHILIKTAKTDTKEKKAAAKKKIEGILKKAKSGKEKFEDLAKKHSEGPSGPNGGDLGFFSKGMMVPPFEKAAFALKDGEISGVVETRFGYHIIKVESRVAAKVVTIKEAKEEIVKVLKGKKSNGKIEGLVAELKKKAKIEKFL